LQLKPARVVHANAAVADLLAAVDAEDGMALWLVEERPGRLCGVLSPFELM